MFKFPLWAPVQKCKGDYKFPGVIVASFCTTAGNVRYVVESTSDGTRGCLHIFNEDQLEKAEVKPVTKCCIPDGF